MIVHDERTFDFTLRDENDDDMCYRYNLPERKIDAGQAVVSRPERTEF